MSISAARFRSTLVAGSTAVVIGSAFVVAGLTQPARQPGTRPADAPLAAAASPSGAGTDGPRAGSSPEPAAVPSTPAASPPATARPSRTVTSPRPAATRKKSATAPATSGSIVEQVLAHINAGRAAEGRKPLKLDAELSVAAARHTRLMMGSCGMSHQCPGEQGLGERISAAGVTWNSVGENIGYGSSGDSDAAKVKTANGLTDAMLAEVPPEDGHRKNLLNPAFTRIGLSVVRDAEGRTWVTQDFAN